MHLSIRRLTLCSLAVLGLLTLGSSPAVLANQTDRQAPTKVDSDKLEHDDQRQVTVFTGKVVLTRGSLTMTGDRLELRQLADGQQLAELKGRPARFRQQRATGSNEWITGESEMLEYDSKTEIVVLTGQATMRRVEGEKLMDQVSGDRLTYNNITEVYQVTVKPGQTRARMTIMPRDQ